MDWTSDVAVWLGEGAGMLTDPVMLVALAAGGLLAPRWWQGAPLLLGACAIAYMSNARAGVGPPVSPWDYRFVAGVPTAAFTMLRLLRWRARRPRA